MKTRSLWMLAVAVLLAGGSVFLAQNWLDRPVQVTNVVQPPTLPTSTVVVAATPLDFGNTIGPEHVRVVEWPASALPAGAFSSVEDLIGDGERRVALRSIQVNEPVLASKVSGFGGRATLSILVGENMRASTIRVNDVNGVAGFVLPNDRVDVLFTRSEGGDRNNPNMATDILLQNIRVLGVDQDASEDSDKPTVVKSVTLEVTPNQAQKLVLAQQLGSLSLVLRNVTNNEAAAVKTIRAKDLRVGEANVATKAPRAVPVAKRKPVASVRVVRGVNAFEYDVEPEKFSRRRTLQPVRAQQPTAPPAPAPVPELTSDAGSTAPDDVSVVTASDTQNLAQR